MREERLPLDYMLARQDTHLPASLEEVRILMVVDGNCQVIKDSGKLTLHKSDYLLINVLEEGLFRIYVGQNSRECLMAEIWEK